jgi:hypothetical protein
MTRLQVLQGELWRYSWSKKGHINTNLVVNEKDVGTRIKEEPEATSVLSRYYRSSKKVDFRNALRTWRTRKDGEIPEPIRKRANTNPTKEDRAVA